MLKEQILTESNVRMMDRDNMLEQVQFGLCTVTWVIIVPLQTAIIHQVWIQVEM